MSQTEVLNLIKLQSLNPDTMVTRYNTRGFELVPRRCDGSVPNGGGILPVWDKWQPIFVRILGSYWFVAVIPVDKTNHDTIIGPKYSSQLI